MLIIARTEPRDAKMTDPISTLGSLTTLNFITSPSCRNDMTSHRGRKTLESIIGVFRATDAIGKYQSYRKNAGREDKRPKRICCSSKFSRAIG